MADTTKAKNLSVPNELPQGSTVSSVSSVSPEVPSGLRRKAKTFHRKAKWLISGSHQIQQSAFFLTQTSPCPAELLDAISSTIFAFVIVDKDCQMPRLGWRIPTWQTCRFMIINALSVPAKDIVPIGS